MTFFTRLKLIGPGLLVTAAFIGPGTITTASRAGAEFGYQLLWVCLVAILITIFLQNLAARLGLLARRDLATAISESLPHPALRAAAAALVILAIGLGNAAYQTGNLTGARLGLETLLATASPPAAPQSTPTNSPTHAPTKSPTKSPTNSATGTASSATRPIKESWSEPQPTFSGPISPELEENGRRGWTWPRPVSFWPLLIGLAATGVLASGSYRRVEFVLIGLVAAMSGVYLLAACLAGPDPGQLASGLLPNRPPGSGLTILALMGTTIVPYNLFLHARLVQEKWPASMQRDEAFRQSRWDTGLSITLGGLISMAVLVSAAVTFQGNPSSLHHAADMVRQLEPVLGPTMARWLFGIGLFAAGMTSAITAPWAAAVATCGVLGWSHDLRDPRCRWVWASVLWAGVVLATWMPSSPTQIIIVAQAANAVLLPLVVLFLLYVVNWHPGMRDRRPSLLQNLVGLGVMSLILVLAGNSLYRLMAG